MKESKRQIMAGIESASSRLVDNNTVEYIRPNGDRVIRLHHTDILTFKPDGCILFDSGGWRTPTTKERMNEHQRSVLITQEKRVWHATVRRGTPDVAEYVYRDGMIYDPEKAAILHAGNLKEIRYWQKKIREYVGKCVKAMPLSLPSGRDCWYCYIGLNEGKPMGANDPSHLRSHVEQGYVVPSLVWYVLLERGCDPHGSRGNGWFHVAFNPGQEQAPHRLSHNPSMRRRLGRWLRDHLEARIIYNRKEK